MYKHKLSKMFFMPYKLRGCHFPILSLFWVVNSGETVEKHARCLMTLC